MTGGRSPARPAAGFHLDDVVVRFGPTAALCHVDLEVRPGEAVALVGPSGAGKTTLLRLLNGTVRATSGSVEVGGASLADLDGASLRDVRAGLAFVPQDLALVPNVRVLANVLAGRVGQQGVLGSLRSVLWPRRRELRAVFALLEEVGIGDKLYARTDTLSGGEQQRVAVARALYQEPWALLADEPIASLDPARGRATIEQMLQLGRDHGLTLVVSLHDLEIARAVFPRLVGLRHGRVAFDAAPEAIGAADLRSLYDLSAQDEAACE